MISWLEQRQEERIGGPLLLADRAPSHHFFTRVPPGRSGARKLRELSMERVHLHEPVNFQGRRVVRLGHAFRGRYVVTTHFDPELPLVNR